LHFIAYKTPFLLDKDHNKVDKFDLQLILLGKNCGEVIQLFFWNSKLLYANF